MIQDKRCWRANGEHFSLVLTRHPSSELKAVMKAYGMLSALSIIHLRSIPFQLSPALIVAILWGEEQLDDDQWLDFNPSIRTLFNQWSATSSGTINNNDWTIEAVLAFECSVSIIYLVLYLIHHHKLFLA